MVDSESTALPLGYTPIIKPSIDLTKIIIPCFLKKSSKIFIFLKLFRPVPGVLSEKGLCAAILSRIMKKKRRLQHQAEYSVDGVLTGNIGTGLSYQDR